MGPVYRADRAAELAMVRTNVEAVVDLCTLFVPGMVTRHRGAVLNTASTAAFQPLPGQAGYGASKAFVLSYGRALGAELRGTGVSVTTLCPGPVETGFAEAAGMTDEEAAETLPKIMWIPADDVASAAVEGLEAGRAVVIPGAANRAAGRVGPSGAQGPPRCPCMAQRHPALKPGRTCRATPAAGTRTRRVTAANVSDAARPRAPCRERRQHKALAVAPRQRPGARHGSTNLGVRRHLSGAHGQRGLMPQLVSELNLPYLDTIGLERREAIDAITAARSVHWLARSELGYSVTRLQDVTAILPRSALPLRAVHD